jgi:hypothetical protein
VGKEGPLVHIGCCAAEVWVRLFPKYYNNEGTRHVSNLVNNQVERALSLTRQTVLPCVIDVQPRSEKS